MEPLVECVPNFSDGRRPEVVQRILDAIQSAPGAVVLDSSSNPDHNRSVVTFVGPPAAVEEGAFRAIARAAELIDMERHQGAHPRIGATDVVPFVPVRAVNMENCVEMARRLGERVGRELFIPVYLYESAASRPERRNLADIRRGEYEGLRSTIADDPQRAPDFGPQQLGSAGATVIGARPFLIAYNVFLDSSDVAIAKKIARAIRHSNGGFHYVKSLGLLVGGLAQVSINLTNFAETPLYRVQEAIRREAERYGTRIKFAEVVGTIPEAALIDAARWYLQIDRMEEGQVLERQLASIPAPPDLRSFAADVAAPRPVPGGGAVAALAGALSAALSEMTAGLEARRAESADAVDITRRAAAVRSSLLAHIDADADAVRRLMQAQREKKDLDPALLDAADVSSAIAEGAVRALELARQAIAAGHPAAVGDAVAAGHMAQAAGRTALVNARLDCRPAAVSERKAQIQNRIAILEQDLLRLSEAWETEVLRALHDRNTSVVP